MQDRLSPKTVLHNVNSREVAPGDIAEMGEISMGEAGCIVHLLCEVHAGFLERRASYFEAGLTYEVLRPLVALEALQN